MIELYLLVPIEIVDLDRIGMGMGGDTHGLGGDLHIMRAWCFLHIYNMA